MQNQALAILTKYWNHTSFRPLQWDIISSVLAGHDTMALLPTGGGKSVCFQIPALIVEGTCLVITPLIALMKDQVANLKKKGIPAVAIYAGLSSKEIDILLDNCVYGNIKFLYVSPERIKSELFQVRLRKMKINMLVIDEAHCIAQWGHDFRPAYLEIATLRNLISVPCLALTATATPEVQGEIIKNLQLTDYNLFIQSFKRANLSYSVINTENKETKLVDILRKVNASAVVYVNSRKVAKDISYLLQKNKISATYYHAGLGFQERNTKQEDWTSGRTRVIVATNAFGMGIDKPDVRTVIHLHVPENTESYYQEAGRAGRDGQKSFAVILYNDADVAEFKLKLTWKFPTIEYLKKVYQSMANFLKIAVGSGEFMSYDFDLAEFCKIYNYDQKESFFAIKRLEDLGFLQLNEAWHAPSKLLIPITQQKLYEFQLFHKNYDALLKTILRLHGGNVFSNYVTLSESSIAKTLGIDESKVINDLIKLGELGMIDYIPQNNKPQLVFTMPRMDAGTLPIKIENYVNRQKLHESKATYIIDYLSNKSVCRTNLLVHYFGESTETTCGICDNCLQTKKVAQYDTLKNELAILVTKEGIYWENILTMYPSTKHDDIKKIIRLNIDNGIWEAKHQLICKL